MEYSFVVKHIRGSNNCTADSLSRLPVVDKGSVSAPFPNVQNATNMNLPHAIKKVDSEILVDVKYLAFYPAVEETTCTISQVVGDSTVAAWDLVPLNIKNVAAATKICKVYGKLYRAVKLGILDKKDKDLSKFQGVFDSLYIEYDVIHFGNRICIPPIFHDRLLTELHMTHIGVVSMKKVVRDIFWWPGITKSIENIAAKCEGCRKFKKKPPPNSLSVWPFARRPMERVHIDYFEFKGKHVLIMVDAFSKKIWTHYLGRDTTTPTTCAVLFNWFCSESGSPTTLVSDNGPQFTSNFFADKMKLWNIKHVFSPPYHPCSNGLAERGVQLVKDRLKKMNVTSRAIDLYVSLAYICKVHGLTPHSSTDRCPYELIKLSNLPSLFPSLISDITQKSELTVTRHCASKLRNRKSFEEGDKVVIYDNHTKLSYSAVVLEVLGTNNYLVQSDNGPKHVSGDVMSREAQPSADVLTHAADNIEDNVIVEDDNISVVSDESEDLQLPIAHNNTFNNNVINVQNNRRGHRELINLGPVPRLPRLRSGRV
ncbi:MAG: DDE-type integrase/transposase/recombinase [Candidatus Scalindua sp.]|nr:DDE-type integrase/transposase/recombinase [Candidatus Scalindua sp.]